jgi:DNA polymerase-3 subunit epsilon
LSVLQKPTFRKDFSSVTISDTTFIVVDTETTGLRAFDNRITEIGMVKVLNGEIIDEYQTLVNPQQFIPPGITRLTGISNELVYDKPKFHEVAHKVSSFIFDNNTNLVLGGHNVSFDYKFINTSFARAGYNELNLESICTCRLARRLNRNLPSKSLSSLVKFFGLHTRRKHRAMDDAKATANILIHFIDRLITEYEMETLDELLSFQYKKIYEPSRIPAKLKKIKIDLKSIPRQPGVYFMKNRVGDIIYIGKAKNLKDRLSSYFYHNTSHTRKIRRLIHSVQSICYEATGSELSALMLESRLIKEHKPRYNSAMRRYRRFPFIKIDVQRAFPRAVKTYEVKPDGAKYFGPFSSSRTVNDLIDRINKTYKLRRCDDVNLIPSYTKPACMYFDMHQCGAPCNLTQNADDYRKEVNRVNKFLVSEEGESALNLMKLNMSRLAEEMNFEEASYVRDRVADLKKVILNMELTGTETEMRNYIIRCRDDNTKSTWEIFFIVNGRIAKTFCLDVAGERDESEIDYLVEEINNFYFNGGLFLFNVFSNASSSLNISEIDRLKIISNWIYQNSTPSNILKITHKTKTADVLNFIFKKR